MNKIGKNNVFSRQLKKPNSAAGVICLCFFSTCSGADGLVIVEHIPLIPIGSVLERVTKTEMNSLSVLFAISCGHYSMAHVVFHRCCSDNYQRFICVGCNSWSSNCEWVRLVFDCDIVRVLQFYLPVQIIETILAATWKRPSWSVK